VLLHFRLPDDFSFVVDLLLSELRFLIGEGVMYFIIKTFGELKTRSLVLICDFE